MIAWKSDAGKEETVDIQQASLYGNPIDDNYEVSIKGVVSEQFLSELLSENPTDKSIYNKMTKYFTRNSKKHLGNTVSWLLGALSV